MLLEQFHSDIVSYMSVIHVFHFASFLADFT